MLQDGNSEHRAEIVILLNNLVSIVIDHDCVIKVLQAKVETLEKFKHLSYASVASASVEQKVKSTSSTLLITSVVK